MIHFQFTTSYVFIAPFYGDVDTSSGAGVARYSSAVTADTEPEMAELQILGKLP